MRILILSQYWQPENGVPQRRWAWLAELAIKSGHEVMVVAPHPHYKRKITNRSWLDSFRATWRSDVEQGPNGEAISRTMYVPSGKSLTGRMVNQLSVAAGMFISLYFSKRVRSFKPHLIIGTVPALPTAIIARIGSIRFGIPFALDLRDAWPDLLAYSKQWNKSTNRKSIREKLFSYGPIQALKVITKTALKRSIEKSDGIIVTSDELRKTIQKSLKDGEKQVVCVRNVFPPVEYDDGLVGVNKNDSGLRVMYAGTIGRAQNLVNVLNAIEIVLKRGKKVEVRFIGEGASKSALLEKVQLSNLPVEFYPQCDLGEITPHYAWADTALVHLTDWEPLKRAVPSKTYELMANHIHISGVASGEVQDLVDGLGAGHVVPPESPEKLAELWIDLIERRSLLDVDRTAASWVSEQREVIAKENFLNFLESFEGV